MATKKELEQFYNTVRYLTLNHGTYGGYATITSQDLGRALDRIDKEWWKIPTSQGGYQVGQTVKVIVPTGKEFKDDKIGEVIHFDGSYILIELKKSKVTIECYPNEIEKIEENGLRTDRHDGRTSLLNLKKHPRVKK